MAFVYNNVACGRLRGGINASQPYAELYPGDVHSFSQWTPGMYFYATITDALGNTEIVKVTDITGNRITIDRGQDNTSAKEWYDGAVINQRLNSAAMDTVIQKASRQVAFDPNGVLTAAYPHEKVFQLGQKIWWKHVAGTDWACVAGRYIPIESCLADRINSGVDTPTDRTYLMKTSYDSVTRVKLDLPATDGTVTKMVLRVRVKGDGRETFRLRYDDGGDPIVLISVRVQDYLSDFTNRESYCEDLGGYSKAVLDKLFVNMSTVEPEERYVSEIEVQLYDIGGNLLETLYPYSDMPTVEGKENWIPVPPCQEGQWLDFTGPDYWASADHLTSWDGERWVANPDIYMSLTVAPGATWNLDFRPRRLRVTHLSEYPGQVSLYGMSYPLGDYMGGKNPYYSGEDVYLAMLPWGDIRRLVVYGCSPITKIEFEII